MSPDTIDETQVRTIWEELDQWAQRLQPWQRFVLAEAVRSGSVSDVHIRNAYNQFLFDYELGTAPNPPLDIPANISGRPLTAAQIEIRISAINSLQSVNALPREAELTFCDGLTVIFGANGVGKSGFTRLLSNACFSRSRYQILPNIYDDEVPPPLAAKIIVTDKHGKERTYAIDGKSEFPELKRIAVFDSVVAKDHIAEKRSLGFSPVGFDVFPEMTRVYAEIAERLDAEIQRLPASNPFQNSFVQPESIISQSIAKLDADTDLAILTNLAIFGHDERERFEEVQRQRDSLKARSVKDTLLHLESTRIDVQLIIDRLDSTYGAMTDQKITAFVHLIGDHKQKVAALAKHGAESFKHPSLKTVGSSEWEDLIKAAQVVGGREHASYPQTGDHCVLCQQALEGPTIELFHRIWKFLESDHRAEVEASAELIDTVIKGLNSRSLEYFEPETTAYVNVARVSPGLARKITNCIQQIRERRGALVVALKEQSDLLPYLRVENIIPELLSLRAQISADIQRLKELDVESALASLETERVTLRHKQVLSQLYPEIQQFVLNKKWEKAARAARSSLSPRGLTVKETELFSIVIAERYREALARECSALKCDMPVVFRTQGQKGQTVKSILIKDEHSPEAILSEGEQRAVAIADFLTEVALNPANAGIVLDDPITSLDHDRKEVIAARLVEEAKRRQVIVFTHDLVFLSMLVAAAKKHVEFLTHWIERDGEGNPGQVCLNDSPVSSKQFHNTQRAQDTLREAKAAQGSQRLQLVRRGMGELRRTVEEIIPHFLFQDVVTRWSNRVIVTGLRKINWDDSLIKDIVDAFEALSVDIEGHSQTEEPGRPPPEPTDLERMIGVVSDIVKRCKKSRAIN